MKKNVRLPLQLNSRGFTVELYNSVTPKPHLTSKEWALPGLFELGRVT
jgi:hypothetical protein